MSKLLDFAKIKTFIKRDYYLVILIFFAIVFFVIYSFLAKSTPLIFNSPDETANYFFAKQYFEKSQIGYFDSLNLFSHGIIHPRSVIVTNGYLTPVSFLGISIIYGTMAKVLGPESIVYLTPFFACLGVLFFYGLIKNIFCEKVAFVSSLILFIHPAYSYYATKTMMHNVLFISLLIIGLYFISALKSTFKEKTVSIDPQVATLGLSPAEAELSSAAAEVKEKIKFLDIDFSFVKSLIYYSLAGLFIGLSLTVRTSESFWVALILLIIGIFYLTKIRWLHLIVAISFFAFAFVPVFCQNKIMYNDWFKSGYTVNYTPKIETTLANAQNLSLFGNTTIEYLKHKLYFFPWDIAFPFGIVKPNVVYSFSNYFISMFLIFNILFLIGLFLFINYASRQKHKKKLLVFLLSGIFASAFLIIFYGSWKFYDNINKEVSIGTSYVRYWLFAYIFTIPFMSLVLTEAWRIFRKYKFHYFSFAAFVLFFIPIAYFSVNLTYLDQRESLISVKNDLWSYYQDKILVTYFTPKDAIIITDRSDKIFFPDRKVISFMSNYAVFDDMPFLVKNADVYYYTMMPAKDIDYINSNKIKEKGLIFVNPIRIDEKNWLYKLIEIKSQAPSPKLQ